MSSSIENLVRENVKAIAPYRSARSEVKGGEHLFLDANENSLGSVGGGNLHRYPDPLAEELAAELAEYIGVQSDNLAFGNGSDELIDLLIRIFCEPKQAAIAVMDPSFGMYEVSAKFNEVTVSKMALADDFSLVTDNVLTSLPQNTKIIFLCSPNNPTGRVIPLATIEAVCSQFDGIVVVDEAYIDYCSTASCLQLQSQFERLVILRTFSKAWGLAGLRLGYAVADAKIVQYINKVKPPYNVNQVTQDLVRRALRQAEKKDEQLEVILAERSRVESRLARFDFVQKVYSSNANFLLVKVSDAFELCEFLLTRNIVIRNRSADYGCKNCVRITIGSKFDNDMLLTALESFPNGTTCSKEVPSDGSSPLTSQRTTVIQRETKETKVEVDLKLEGKGRAQIATGLSFFDHMLEQLAKHSYCDLRIEVEGDLEVDEHHTIEDTAIALGQAFREALGDKAGINRYGFLLPMDDALAQVAIDFSGRPWLVWEAEFAREKIGDMPTEMFKHFFKSFCDTAGCNLNIKAEGENEHHKIESIFKAFAKSIRAAVTRNPDYMFELPSTKGTL